METAHEIHSIKAAKVIGQHSLQLTFEDGFQRDVDLSPVLHGRRFGPLRDPKYFAQVRINPDLETIEWPTGADFDPETLYHWDWYVEDLRDMAEKWEGAEA
jgi:uncharacterized protein DUF2442